MAAVKTPHYIDVVTALEKAVCDMSLEAGLGLKVSNHRFLIPRQKRLEFSFQRIGDNRWAVRMAVEKVGGESSSSAYCVQVWLPGGEFKQETVYLTNDEQLADLGLHYAELISAAAAEPEPALTG